MKARYRAILSAFLGTASVLASGLGTPAHAAEDGEESTSGAGALIERGIAARRAGDDASALPLFQEAERLEPNSTRVMVHLAAVYQALGQWEQADRYLTRALRDPTEAYVHKHQAMLAEARRTVDAHIARLRLTGGPPGTEVRLNGKPIGTLPMTETMRVEAGLYTLEASLPGYYPVSRSVALAGGALAQESIELTPQRKRELAVAPREAEPVADEGDSQWLTWTLGGLAVAAAGGTVFAWVKREQHADVWNDNDRCLSSTRTRGQLCGDELDKGERAETWMWIGGAATAVFTGAAIGSLWLGDRGDGAAESALNCGVGLAAVQCAGRF